MDAEIKDGKLKWTLVISLLVRQVRSLFSSSTYVWPLQLWMPGHQKCNSSRDMTKVPLNFFFFFVMLPGLQGLSSPPRTEYGPVAMKVPSPNLWTTREFLPLNFKLCWKVKLLVIQLCLTLYDPMDCSPKGSSVHCPWASPGKNIGVGCHFLSQWLGAGATSGQTQWWIQMVVTYSPTARDLSGVISGEAAFFSWGQLS